MNMLKKNIKIAIRKKIRKIVCKKIMTYLTILETYKIIIIKKIMIHG